MIIDKKLQAKIKDNYAHGDWTLIGQNLGISSAAVRQAVAAGNGSLRVVTELENFYNKRIRIKEIKEEVEKRLQERIAKIENQ